MDADRAYELGLVNAVVPFGALDACVEEWAHAIVESAPLSTRAIKQAFYGSDGVPLSQAFGAHYPAEELRRCSHDAVEGIRAFVEKRAPNWTGM